MQHTHTHCKFCSIDGVVHGECGRAMTRVPEASLLLCAVACVCASLETSLHMRIACMNGMKSCKRTRADPPHTYTTCQRVCTLRCAAARAAAQHLELIAPRDPSATSRATTGRTPMYLLSAYSALPAVLQQLVMSEAIKMRGEHLNPPFIQSQTHAA